MTRLATRPRERRPTYAGPEPAVLTPRREDGGAVSATVGLAAPAVSARRAGSRLRARLERGRVGGGGPCRILLAAEASLRTAELTVMLLEAVHQVTVVATVILRLRVTAHHALQQHATRQLQTAIRQKALAGHDLATGNTVQIRGDTLDVANASRSKEMRPSQYSSPFAPILTIPPST